MCSMSYVFQSVLMDGGGGLKPVYTMTSSPTVQENSSQPLNSQPINQQSQSAANTQLQSMSQAYQPVSTGIYS